MLTTLCFQYMGYGLCWKHVLSLLLSRSYRGSFATIYVGFAGNGYLDDMCCVRLSRNLNVPFANSTAELSRTPNTHAISAFIETPTRDL